MDKEHDNAPHNTAIPVSIEIAADAPSPRVVIYTSEVSNEVRELAGRIGSITGTLGRREFVAYDGEHVILVPFSAIYSIYARDKKVYVRTSNAHYRLKMTLREAEDMTQGTRLIRISKSVLSRRRVLSRHSIRILLKTGSMERLPMMLPTFCKALASFSRLTVNFIVFLLIFMLFFHCI